MQNFFNHLPIRTLRGKFLTFNIPLMLITLVCVFAVFAIADYKNELEELNQHIDEIIENSKGKLGLAMAFKHEELQHGISDQILNDPNIIAVILYDKNDNQIYTVTKNGTNAQSYISERMNQVFYNKEFVGSLKIIATSKNFLHETSSRLLLDLYLSIIIVLTLTLGALIANRYTIDLPLSKLLNAVELTKSTQINYTVNWDSKDEIGVLITAFNEMQLRLQNQTEYLTIAKEHAIAGNKAKDEFIANISHELRTPMHTIMGLANLGTKKSATWSKEQTLDVFTDISTSSERLLTLLNELLEVAKLESGKTVFNIKQNNLERSVHDVIKELAPYGIEKSIRILTNIDSTYSYNAEFDYSKICQVIRNIIFNAIKYTPRDGVITVSLHTDQSNNIVCSIKDSGNGITENDLANVFDKFFQGDNAKNVAQGYGLGLAICKEIIAKHNGDIVARNSSSGGAIFIFTIPKRQNGYG